MSRLTMLLFRLTPIGIFMLAQMSAAQVHRPNGTPAPDWRVKPVSALEQADSVRPADRSARTAYWSARLSPFMSQANGAIDVESVHEFTRTRDSLWIVGKFGGYSIFATPGKDSLPYTELHFSVEHTFLSAESPSSIDIGLPGGTLIEPNGKQLKWLPRANQHYFELGKTYLIRVEHQMPGNFYLETGDIWDVSGPAALPAGQISMIVNYYGHSTISGTSTKTLIPRVEKILESVAVQ